MPKAFRSHIVHWSPDPWGGKLFGLMRPEAGLRAAAEAYYIDYTCHVLAVHRMLYGRRRVPNVDGRGVRPTSACRRPSGR